MSTEQTTTAITASKPSALVAMANRFSVEPEKLLNTLKGTVFKNATNEQLMALVVVSNEYGLNPFTKQIFAFPDKGGGIIPVVSVDGWLHMMQEHPQFDGIEYEWERDGGNKPVSCTAIIYRKDRSKPTKVTEFLSECSRNTDPWNKSPSRMLRHRATIQCIRVAFGFSVSDPEDAERALERDITPSSPSKAPRLHEVPLPEEMEILPTEPSDDDQRSALFNTLAEAMDEDGIAASHVLRWASKKGVIQSEKVQLKDLPMDELKVLVERWPDIKSA